jgi:hypothetical protein
MRARPPPNACDAQTLTEESNPNPKTIGTASTVLAKAHAANGTTPTWPTIIVSAHPMSICPTKPAMMGDANESVRRFSEIDWAKRDMKNAIKQDAKGMGAQI